MSFLSYLNNLTITTVGGGVNSGIAAAMNTLQSTLANGGRDRNCKFYYNYGGGGSILQVAVKGVVGGAVSELRNDATNLFNSWLNGKKEPAKESGKWFVPEVARQQEDIKNYGKMSVNNGKDTVYALDDWGCVCPDALMLGIAVDQKVRITQKFPNYRQNATGLTDDTGQFVNASTADITGNFRSSESITNDIAQSDTLVWYDTTALVTINSDKNMVVTRVAGRDYSRKELVSNGDIKFSVSGQITSSRPDTYPTEEVKKFIKCMQYKGIVRINNQTLDQFGITHIVIENFNLSPREGYKAVQQYSFSAIGLQPESEIEITEDTVTITRETSEAAKDDSSGWMKMLNSQLNGLKSMASDMFTQGTGLAAGLLDNVL